MLSKNFFYVILASSISLLVLGTHSLQNWYQSRPHYTIGLVYIATRALPEYIKHALTDAINKDGRFAIREFTVARSSDLCLVKAACHDALTSNADLLITVGMHCSANTVAMGEKRNSTKPIIFVGILDACKHKLVKSLENPGGYATGVESSSVFENSFDSLDLLRIIKPRVEAVLLPYALYTAETVKAHAKVIKASAKKAGIDVTLLPINQLSESQLHELLTQPDGLLPDHDALMYLETDSISIYGPSLGKLASQYGVTMFAGSIDGIDNAAISYAADPSCLPEVAFAMAKEILLEHKNTGDVPVRQVTVPRNLIINTKLCKEQGLEDIDVAAVVRRIRADARFAPVHEHIVVDGVVV